MVRVSETMSHTSYIESKRNIKTMEGYKSQTLGEDESTYNLSTFWPHSLDVLEREISTATRAMDIRLNLP